MADENLFYPTEPPPAPTTDQDLARLVQESRQSLLRSQQIAQLSYTQMQEMQRRPGGVERLVNPLMADPMAPGKVNLMDSNYTALVANQQVMSASLAQLDSFAKTQFAGFVGPASMRQSMTQEAQERVAIGRQRQREAGSRAGSHMMYGMTDTASDVFEDIFLGGIFAPMQAMNRAAGGRGHRWAGVSDRNWNESSSVVGALARQYLPMQEFDRGTDVREMFQANRNNMGYNAAAPFQKGLTATQAQGMHGTLRELGTATGIGEDAVIGLTERMLGRGEIRTTNIDKIKELITDKVTKIKEVATVLDATLSDAEKTVNELERNFGRGMNVGAFTGTIRARGVIGGVGTGAMLQAAWEGAQMLNRGGGGEGVSRALGADIGSTAMASMGFLQSTVVLSATDIERAGGMPTATRKVSAAMDRFLNENRGGGMGVMAAAAELKDGKMQLNQDFLRRYQSGLIDESSVQDIARAKMSKDDFRLKFFYQKEDLSNQMTAKDTIGIMRQRITARAKEVYQTDDVTKEQLAGQIYNLGFADLGGSTVLAEMMKNSEKIQGESDRQARAGVLSVAQTRGEEMLRGAAGYQPSTAASMGWGALGGLALAGFAMPFARVGFATATAAKLAIGLAEGGAVAGGLTNLFGGQENPLDIMRSGDPESTATGQRLMQQMGLGGNRYSGFQKFMQRTVTNAPIVESLRQGTSNYATGVDQRVGEAWADLGRIGQVTRQIVGHTLQGVGGTLGLDSVSGVGTGMVNRIEQERFASMDRETVDEVINSKASSRFSYNESVRYAQKMTPAALREKTAQETALNTKIAALGATYEQGGAGIQGLIHQIATDPTKSKFEVGGKAFTLNQADRTELSDLLWSKDMTPETVEKIRETLSKNDVGSVFGAGDSTTMDRFLANTGKAITTTRTGMGLQTPDLKRMMESKVRGATLGFGYGSRMYSGDAKALGLQAREMADLRARQTGGIWVDRETADLSYTMNEIFDPEGTLKKGGMAILDAADAMMSVRGDVIKMEGVRRQTVDQLIGSGRTKEEANRLANTIKNQFNSTEMLLGRQAVNVLHGQALSDRVSKVVRTTLAADGRTAADIDAAFKGQMSELGLKAGDKDYELYRKSAERTKDLLNQMTTDKDGAGFLPAFVEAAGRATSLRGKAAFRTIGGSDTGFGSLIDQYNAIPILDENGKEVKKDDPKYQALRTAKAAEFLATKGTGAAAGAMSDDRTLAALIASPDIAKQLQAAGMALTKASDQLLAAQNKTTTESPTGTQFEGDKK